MTTRTARIGPLLLGYASALALVHELGTPMLDAAWAVLATIPAALESLALAAVSAAQEPSRWVPGLAVTAFAGLAAILTTMVWDTIVDHVPAEPRDGDKPLATVHPLVTDGQRPTQQRAA